MKTLRAIFLITLWMMSATASETSREDWQIKLSFETAQTVILAELSSDTITALQDLTGRCRGHQRWIVKRPLFGPRQ